ncbi:MAG TPA: PAS-domain containing protein, partial [Stellaceae bacterium]|nr:PAS-domain containing protein [Stellaceae bacterium]
MAAAAVLGALWLLSCAQRRRAEAARIAAERRQGELAAMLDMVAAAVFRWPREDASTALPGYREFLETLSPADAARVEEGRRRLQREGTPFSAVVALRSGEPRAVEGRRATNGDTVLWLPGGAAVGIAEASRAAAEKAARKLREMIDAIPLPLWRRGEDLALVDCNEAYAAALDASRERVLAERRELLGGNARGTPGEMRRERRHVVIAGSRRLLEISEMPARSGGTIGFALDRTEIETAEAELVRHVSAHAQVLESIHAAVAIFGADKRLKFFNAGFATLWGLDEEWLAHEPSLDQIMEQLRERRRLPEVADFRAYKREWLALFTSLIEPQQELMHLPDDRTIRLSISPHPFGGLLFVAEDVTDRLAIERLYNTLSAVQRATLDHLFEGIAVFGSDGRLKLHNPAYRAIWGLSEQDMAGEPHIGEIVEKMRPYFEENGNWPAVKEGIVAKVMTHTLSSGPLYRRDGSVLQVVTVPLPDGNVLLTYLDVSDTARVERALREKNEALETAARLKSEFIANVSHELKTPLSLIRMFSELIALGKVKSAETGREYAEIITRESERLTRLIDNVLDFARIERGKAAYDFRIGDLAEVVERSLDVYRYRLEREKMKLEIDLEPDLPPVRLDDNAMTLALLNLLENAVKYAAPGNVAVRVHRAGPTVELAVIDHGPGIPEDEHRRIFDRFYRAKNTRGRNVRGSGI